MDGISGFKYTKSYVRKKLTMKIPENPNWNHLHCFFQVARDLSMTKAAERMCISVPSVSAQIRSLEIECGSPLFFRKARSLVLTREGAILLNAVHRLFDDTSKSLRQISQGQDFLSTLELNLQKGWHQFYVQEALGNLKQEGLPRIELRSYQSEDGAVSGASRGAVIAPADRVERGRDEVRTVLYSEDYYFCGAKKVLKKHTSLPKSLAAQMPFMLWWEDWDFSRKAVEALLPDRLPAPQLLRSDFPQFLLKMLHGQPFLSLLPQTVLRQQPLLERLPWGRPLRRDIILLARRGSLEQNHAGTLKKVFAQPHRPVVLPQKGAEPKR